MFYQKQNINKEEKLSKNKFKNKIRPKIVLKKKQNSISFITFILYETNL